MKKLLQLFLTCFAFMYWQDANATTCAGAQAGVLGSNTLVCSGTNDISGISGCGSTNYQGGDEALITYTPLVTGTMTLDYVGITWTGIFVWDDCPTTGNCVGIPVTSTADNKSMSVPVTAGVTYYIMVDTYPTPNAPCPGTLDITVVPTPTCAEPTGASSETLSFTEVNLDWTTGGATDWIVEYGPAGFTQGAGTTEVLTGNDSLNITGLTANTYVISIETTANCESNNISVTLNDPATPNAPIVSNNSPVCVGDDVQLTASSVAGGSYLWTGAGISSPDDTLQNPLLTMVLLVLTFVLFCQVL